MLLVFEANIDGNGLIRLKYDNPPQVNKPAKPFIVGECIVLYLRSLKIEIEIYC
jgi:hypothetical protein